MRDSADVGGRSTREHPDIDALLGYAEALLSADERDRIEEHIDACADCRALVVHAIRERPTDAPRAAGSASSLTPSAAMPLPAALALPARVGRYRILDRIGIGGMGVVCSAFDPDLERVVAVKLVRRDRNDEDGGVRLQREARALASLAHPNVVTVFECGNLDDGGIYLVMEMVEGETLRRWCSGRSPEAILAAYLDAAAGLAAAHAVGIVHRDFKPDNVLVDHATGRVRVGDFGLAREITATTLPTALDASASGSASASDIAGTPAYMAPEQLDGRDIGPAADQYAFCVSLWESLAGALPPGGDRQRIAAHVRRAIARGTDADPGRRWPSIGALASVLRRRRRWPLVAAGVAAAAMLVAVALPSTDDGGLDVACARAVAGIDRAWSDERRAAIAAITDAADLVPAIDRWVSQWRAHAERACVDDPTPLRADGCLALATVELDTIVGVLERAGEVTPEARGAVLDFAATAACRSSSPMALPDDDARVVAVRTKLAEASALQAMRRYDGAKSLSAAAVAEAEDLGQPLLALALQRHSQVLHAAGEFAAEIEAAERCFLVARSAGADDIAAGVATTQVFTTSRIGRDFESAATWARHAASAIERMPESGRALATARLVEARGHISQGQGRADEAASLYAEAIAAFTRIEGVSPSELAGAHNDYGTTIQAADPEAALASYERSLAILRDHYQGLHPRIAMMLSNIAGLHYNRGNYEIAEEKFAEAAQMMSTLLGDEHHDVAGAYINLGLVQDRLGDTPRALASVHKGLAIFVRVLGPEHPEVGITRVNLGAIELRSGDLDAAQAEFEAAMTSFEVSVGPDHTYCTNALRGLAEVEVARGRPARAVELERRALAIDRKDGLDAVALAPGQRGLADSLYLAGQRDEAHALVREAIAAVEASTAAASIRDEATAELRTWQAEHASAR